MKSRKTITLVLCILVGLFLGSLLQVALASSDRPLDYSEEALAAPLYGRPAPYGQYAITHLSETITTTANWGTVARTNGYDCNKVIMCDVGAYAVDLDLLYRVESTGEVYTISTGTTLPASTRSISTFTGIAPWMSLRLTSEITGSTTTCGIYMQTP